MHLGSAGSCANTNSVVGFYTDIYWNGCIKFLYLLLPLHSLHKSCLFSFHFSPAHMTSLSLSFSESISAILYMLLIVCVCIWLPVATQWFIWVLSLCSGGVGCSSQCGSCAHHVFMLGTWCPNIYSQSVVWELQIAAVCLMTLARNVCFNIWCFLLNSLCLDCLVDHTHIHTITLDYPVDSKSAVM